MNTTKALERYISLIGRLLFGGVFLVNAVGLIHNLGSVVDMMAIKGVPIPLILLAVTICIWVAGGLSLILGYKIRWGAMMLAVVLLPVTLCIHAPWFAGEANFANELNHFLKNFAIVGGLLYMAGCGAGSFSLDGRSRPPYSAKTDLPHKGLAR